MHLLYFSMPSCSACPIIEKKVAELIKRNFPRMQYTSIDCIQQPAISASYGIFSAPTLLLYIEGKEYFRHGGNISMSELETILQRYYRHYFH